MRLANEYRHIQRVILPEPQNELRVGQEQPKQTKAKIEMAKFHGFDFLATLANLSSRTGINTDRH